MGETKARARPLSRPVPLRAGREWDPSTAPPRRRPLRRCPTQHPARQHPPPPCRRHRRTLRAPAVDLTPDDRRSRHQVALGVFASHHLVEERSRTAVPLVECAKRVEQAARAVPHHFSRQPGRPPPRSGWHAPLAHDPSSARVDNPRATSASSLAPPLRHDGGRTRLGRHQRVRSARRIAPVAAPRRGVAQGSTATGRRGIVARACAALRRTRPSARARNPA